MKGLFLINKPRGLKSTEVINRFKKIFPKEKIGHGGTLDPLANGLLIIGVGREFTKKLSFYQKEVKKEYLVTIDLSKKSTTYDLAGEITSLPSSIKPSLEEINLVLAKEFLGPQFQKPPLLSAKKLNGKRAYKYFYEGENVDLKPAKVTLYDFKVVEYNYPFLILLLLVSSGYYIRSLARDLGEKLQVGNLITELTRTKVDDFNLSEAIDFSDFPNKVSLYGKLSGLVQNIGFRFFIFQRAKELFLSGWVKNVLPNIIEFVIQGELETLDRFQDEILNYPPAKINSFEFIFKTFDESLVDFTIKETQKENFLQRFNI